MEHLKYYTPDRSLVLPVGITSADETAYLLGQHPFTLRNLATTQIRGMYYPEIEHEEDSSGWRVYICNGGVRRSTGDVSGVAYDKDGYIFRNGADTALIAGEYLDDSNIELSVGWVVTSFILGSELELNKDLFVYCFGTDTK